MLDGVKSKDAVVCILQIIYQICYVCFNNFESDLLINMGL